MALAIGKNGKRVHDRLIKPFETMAQDLDIPIRMIVDEVTIGDHPPLDPQDAGI